MTPRISVSLNAIAEAVDARRRSMALATVERLTPLNAMGMPVIVPETRIGHVLTVERIQALAEARRRKLGLHIETEGQP